jgi:hypothetical protein
LSLTLFIGTPTIKIVSPIFPPSEMSICSV